MNQKKVNLVLDLEEVNAGLSSFTNTIIGIVNSDDDDSSNEPSIEETDAFPPEEED